MIVILFYTESLYHALLGVFKKGDLLVEKCDFFFLMDYRSTFFIMKIDVDSSQPFHFGNPIDRVFRICSELFVSHRYYTALLLIQPHCYCSCICETPKFTNDTYPEELSRFDPGNYSLSSRYEQTFASILFCF
jgi:hypothetical protein